MPKIALIDLFCGAGGTTTGVEHAKMFGKKVAKVIACVNHDSMAIKSHRSNHKGVLHFTEDIRTLNLNRILKLVKKYRDQGYIIALWASLECTNFSLAKGGLPRDADSRTLAEHLIRYIMEICPEYVFIENVMEFMSWGPLDEKGKPVSRDKGKDYIRWVDEIKSYGYRHDWRKINSADFGSYQSRKRYFGVFAKGNLPIAFPKATHSKKPEKERDLFSQPLKKWKSVKDVLDLQDEGKSIFNRKKPLKEKTLRRIYDGLLKYVAGGSNMFMMKYYGSGGQHQSTDQPSGTLTTRDRIANIYIKSYFLLNPSWYGNPGDIEQPSPTIVARQDKAPLYFLVAEKSDSKLTIPVFESDSEMMVKIKEFMILHNISDIKMRMLKVSELLKIQGFPKNYILQGNQAQQKKFIGNSVVPLVAEVLIKETYRALNEYFEQLEAA